MTVNTFISQLRSKSKEISFSDCISLIDATYRFTPTEFRNGDIVNQANQNNGSCKIFAFAQMHQLSKEETLASFGTYYTKDVLQNTEGDDHQNIRNFMQYAWDGIQFSGQALELK